MALYAVKKVDLSSCNGVDEYIKAVSNAPVKYCYGLKEVFDYCGAKLHKGRAGYSGFFNNVEYTAVKIR